MNLLAIHARHKKVLNEWKDYRVKECDKLSDLENEKLDKFIVDFAHLLSDLNNYINKLDNFPGSEAKAIKFINKGG